MTDTPETISDIDQAIIDALTAERDELRVDLKKWIRATYRAWAECDRYRHPLERAERVINDVLAQPMPGGLVDLHGGGELRSRLVDVRTNALAVLNPPEPGSNPKEPT